MSRDLAAARMEEVARAARRHVVRRASTARSSCSCPGPDGRARSRERRTSPAGDAREGAVAQWVFDHRQRGRARHRHAARRRRGLRSARGHAVGRSGCWACGPDPRAAAACGRTSVDLLEALRAQVASGLERARLADEAQQARVAVEAERLRSTLLSSVSHDLRTPLATITGAASSCSRTPRSAPTRSASSLETIHEEAGRLNRLVSNLLDMTRLESGALQLNRDWQSPGGAGRRRPRRASSRPGGPRRSGSRFPADLPLVPVRRRPDRAGPREPPRERGQVHGRRSRHRGDGRERRTTRSSVEVADEGPGPARRGGGAGLREVLSRRRRPGGGFGLGLPICRAIVTAHGGRIWAENREPRGRRVPLHAAPGASAAARARGRR